jgi:hypothetical protein
LQAIEREETVRPAASRPAWRWWWQPKWLVRGGVAAVVLALGLLTVHLREERQQQAGMIRSIASVSGDTPVPSLEILTNFEVIVVLNTAATDRTLALARPDNELLELFK